MTGIGSKEIHGHMDPLRLSIVDRQISPLGGSTAENCGVEILG